MTESEGERRSRPQPHIIVAILGSAVFLGLLLLSAVTFIEVGQVAALVFTLLCATFLHGHTWPRLYGLHRLTLSHFVISLVMAPGLTILNANIYSALCWLLNLDAEQYMRNVQQIINMGPLWQTIFVIGVMPGVVEELWFRGFLNRGLLARYGRFWGIFATSVLFGLIHLSPIYIVVVAIMGAMFHVCYLLTRSLWVPILLHIINNTLSVLLVRPEVPQIQSLEARTETLGVFVPSLVLTLAGFWALWTCRTREVHDPAEPGRTYLTSSLPRPAALLMIVLAFAMMMAMLLR